MDWTAIAVAGITAVGMGTLPALLTARLGRKVDRVHQEVRTNHGKPASWYLEMIADVKQDVGGLKEGQDALFGLFVDHTEVDERQFAELRREIRRKAA